MERWCKYKNQYINLGQARNIHVDRADKEMQAWHEKIGASKKKPYILFIDHIGLDAFESRDVGMKVADDLIAGKYDCP